MLANSLLVFAVINVLAVAGMAIYERLWAPPTAALGYGIDRLSRVYPHRSPDEIESLLTETWSREYAYAPLVQHKEASRQGSWVNVDPVGFRHSADQGRWPPSPETSAVFFYGGSTAFGYGVADAESIPSRLQESLNKRGCEREVRVYNFGRGNYYGEQERVLFGTHLVAGHVPSVAVFLDGLNEWKQEPKFTARLEYLMREPPSGLWRRAIRALPLLQLLRGSVGRTEVVAVRDDPAAFGAAVVERWLASRRLIAAAADAFGVRALFVWQPVPTYLYEIDNHLFGAESTAAFSGPLPYGYARLDSLRGDRAELRPEEGFLWLADLQLGRQEPLYVDGAHYTAAFSRDIADRIGDQVAPWVGCGGPVAGPLAQPE